MSLGNCPKGVIFQMAEYLEFQPITEEDFEVCVQLRIASMRESLERVGRFDPERGRQRLRESFFPESMWFIVVDGVQVGFFGFRLLDAVFRLDNLYLVPQFQHCQLGSTVMKRCVDEAELHRSAITVCALKQSESNFFYRHHGFEVVEETEWDIEYIRPYRAVPSE